MFLRSVTTVPAVLPPPPSPVYLQVVEFIGSSDFAAGCAAKFSEILDAQAEAAATEIERDEAESAEDIPYPSIGAILGQLAEAQGFGSGLGGGALVEVFAKVFDRDHDGRLSLGEFIEINAFFFSVAIVEAARQAKLDDDAAAASAFPKPYPGPLPPPPPALPTPPPTPPLRYGDHGGGGGGGEDGPFVFRRDGKEQEQHYGERRRPRLDGVGDPSGELSGRRHRGDDNRYGGGGENDEHRTVSKDSQTPSSLVEVVDEGALADLDDILAMASGSHGFFFGAPVVFKGEEEAWVEDDQYSPHYPGATSGGGRGGTFGDGSRGGRSSRGEYFGESGGVNGSYDDYAGEYDDEFDDHGGGYGHGGGFGGGGFGGDHVDHGDWYRVWDDFSQSFYYANSVTRVSSWEPPPQWVDSGGGGGGGGEPHSSGSGGNGGGGRPVDAAAGLRSALGGGGGGDGFGRAGAEEAKAGGYSGYGDDCDGGGHSEEGGDDRLFARLAQSAVAGRGDTFQDRFAEGLAGTRQRGKGEPLHGVDF